MPPTDSKCHNPVISNCNSSLYPIMDYTVAGWFFHVPFKSCRPLYTDGGVHSCAKNMDLPMTKSECEEICGEEFSGGFSHRPENNNYYSDSGVSESVRRLSATDNRGQSRKITGGDRSGVMAFFLLFLSPVLLLLKNKKKSYGIVSISDDFRYLAHDNLLYDFFFSRRTTPILVSQFRCVCCGHKRDFSFYLFTYTENRHRYFMRFGDSLILLRENGKLNASLLYEFCGRHIGIIPQSICQTMFWGWLATVFSLAIFCHLFFPIEYVEECRIWTCSA